VDSSGVAAWRQVLSPRRAQIAFNPEAAAFSSLQPLARGLTPVLPAFQPLHLHLPKLPPTLVAYAQARARAQLVRVCVFAFRSWLAVVRSARSCVRVAFASTPGVCSSASHQLEPHHTALFRCIQAAQEQAAALARAGVHQRAFSLGDAEIAQRYAA
jgi:hypothetical protein